MSQIYFKPFETNPNNVNAGTMWDKYIQEYSDFLEFHDVSKEARKLAGLRHCAGPRITEIINRLQSQENVKLKTEAEAQSSTHTEKVFDYKQAIAALHTHFNPKRNLMFEQYNFQRCLQLPEEGIQAYVTRLYTLYTLQIRRRRPRDRQSHTRKRKLLLAHPKDAKLGRGHNSRQNPIRSNAQRNLHSPDERHKILELRKPHRQTVNSQQPRRSR